MYNQIYTKLKKHKSGAGFTLIELLTVIGIAAVLAAVAVPSYALMQKNVSLSSTAQEVVNTLRVAQNNAISSQDGVMWGVRFGTNQYILFKCNSDCSILNNITTYNFQNGVQVTQGTGTIIFNHLTGANNNPSGTPPIVLNNRKNIQVDGIGKIILQ